jgi:hypothetical protein
MRAANGGRLPSIRELVELGPALVDRSTLETRPGRHTVASYVLTRAAERAWEAIGQRLSDNAGGVLWICGPAGSGKTQFLNYVLALERKAGAAEGSPRRLPVGLEGGASSKGEGLAARLLEALCRELAVSPRDATLWRQMGGAEALTVALDQASRLGVGAVTVVVDLGLAEAGPAGAYLAPLLKGCERKHPKLLVIAAARSGPPASAPAFDVAPADWEELVTVAIGRVRLLKEGAEQAVSEFYRTVDPGRFAAPAIFPFHPLAIAALRTIADGMSTISETARIARSALAPDDDGRLFPYRRLIMPADLMAAAAGRARVEARLGESGRAALKTVRTALEPLSGDEGRLARQIVDTLVLAQIGDGSTRLSVAELAERLPQGEALETARKPAQLATLLTALASRTAGAIKFESGAARFDPRGAGAPQLAAFNAALPVLQRFDPSLTAAHELPELKAKLKRLADAMANALEVAHHTDETLAPAAGQSRDQLPAERLAALPDYIALAAAGPGALLEAASDPARRDTVSRTIAAYEALAGAAAAAPRLWAMRDYLHGTGLKWDYADERGKDGKITALESECQLLDSQLNQTVLLSEPHNLDALQARFQQFRWSYVQEYRAAHERWRAEMNRLAPIAEDARRHLDALGRLNAIAALGPPAGAELGPAMADLEPRIVRCDFEGQLAPEVAPRCPRCAFTLGTPSPKGALNELFAQIKAALRQKLLAVSRSAIARLIREYDAVRRLEGFLKITQAVQTDELVRVLDDDLAAYLARLIDDNLAAAEESGRGRRKVVTAMSERRHKSGSKRH